MSVTCEPPGLLQAIRPVSVTRKHVGPLRAIRSMSVTGETPSPRRAIRSLFVTDEHASLLQRSGRYLLGAKFPVIYKQSVRFYRLTLWSSNNPIGIIGEHAGLL